MKRFSYIFCCFTLASCAATTPTNSQEENIPGDSTEEVTVELCQHQRLQAEMVKITSDTWGTFCIDRYEAFYLSGALGNSQQNSDDTSMVLDGSTTAKVGSLAGQTPLTGVSWYQAMAACQNSGAHLCTKEEWETACRGSASNLYPYGPTFVEQQCNDYYYRQSHEDLSNDNSDLLLTGSLETCQTGSQIFDLSGNAEEWIATATSALPDSQLLDHRLTRGGSYRSNNPALQCVDNESHYSPSHTASDLGFRCCLKIED